MTRPEGAGPSSTGDGEVDRILSALHALSSTPVSDHAALYVDVHDRLSRHLAPEQKVPEAGAHGAT